MSGLFDKTTEGLSSSIYFRLLNHNLITSNIANAETPNFKAKKMDFEDILSRALELHHLDRMKTKDEKHYTLNANRIKSLKPRIYDNPDVKVSNDGNTVNLEREMTALAENTLLYKAALQLINKKIASLKYAVTEGGR